MALKGRKTLNTLRILTTEIASDLEQRLVKEKGEIQGVGNKIRMIMMHFFCFGLEKNPYRQENERNSI